MTVTRYIPLLFFVALAVLSFFMDFNGLYGQDAHEYLRQSRVLFGRLHGLPASAPGMGEAEMAGGYPFLGALVQLTGLESSLSMQVVSWLGASLALWLMVQLLQLLSPGARAWSRWIWVLLALGVAPVFLRAGITVMSDVTGLALLLAALFFGMRSIELERPADMAGFVVFAVLAVSTRYALAAVLALPGLALLLERWRNRQWGWLVVAFGAGALALLPFIWMRAPVAGHLAGHSMVQDWSFFHLFSRTFTQVNGTLSYTLPNLLYILFPFAHPGFCLVLPGLFLLAKRTDVHLNAKRILALTLLVYLLFLGGVPNQNIRFLLPAYAILVLLLFPAWDRFFAYGLYFFPRLVYALLGLTVAIQVVFCIYFIRPTVLRHNLERQVAAVLHADLEPRDIVYGLDLDIALQSYLPEVEFRNLWMQRYPDFPEGSYLLFNLPKLERQWAGENPMVNWEYAASHYNLQEIRFLPEGWVLYRVIKQK